MIALQPADILLWRVDPGSPLMDRLIGWAESRMGQHPPGGYQYYHVAIVSGDVSADGPMMYSAQPPKIDLYPVPNPWPSYLEVMRLKVPPTPNQLRLMFEYAESRRGKLYDFIGCATAGFLEIGGLEFCSQYTEDAFEQVQYVLSPDVRFTTPDDIAASSLIQPVF